MRVQKTTRVLLTVLVIMFCCTVLFHAWCRWMPTSDGLNRQQRRVHKYLISAGIPNEGIVFTCCTPVEDQVGVYLSGPQVQDLPYLAGLPICVLGLFDTKVTDLSPLSGLALYSLRIRNGEVTDIGPLSQVRIRCLSLENTGVTDLSPLNGTLLTSLRVFSETANDFGSLTNLPHLQEVYLVSGESVISDVALFKTGGQP